MLSKAVSSRTCAGLFVSVLRIPSHKSPIFTRILGPERDNNFFKSKSQLPTICGRFYSLETGEDREFTVSKSVEAALKARDRIPDDYRIVYRAPIENYVKYTYLSTAAAIAVVPTVGICLYLTKDGWTEYPVQMAGIPLFDTPMDAYLALLMLIVTIANVAHTIGKYPFRIYRQPTEHKYIAVFQHLIPLMVRKKEFKAGELRKSNGLIWKDALFIMKDKSVIIVEDHFTSNIELERMMIEPPTRAEAEIKKRRSRMI